MLTLKECADRLRVSERTLRGLAAAGKFPASRVGSQWRVKPADLDAYIERGKVGQPTVDAAG